MTRLQTTMRQIAAEMLQHIAQNTGKKLPENTEHMVDALLKRFEAIIQHDAEIRIVLEDDAAALIAELEELFRGA